MLEQSENKQDILQRTWFIGVQQEKLEGVLATIGNSFQFARTIVSFDMNNLDSFPLILLRMSEFVDFIYDNDFKDYHNKNLDIMPWLPHLLLTYL